MPRIAVFTKNRTNPAYEAARLGADRTAARLGAHTVHYVPETPDSVPEQIALITQAISERPDAAVFVPVDETAVNDAIRGFDAAGIPLFNIVTRTTAGRRITFVGSDDRALARNIARYLFGKLSRRSTIIILEGTPASATSRERLLGFQDALAEHPAINVRASLRGDYQREVAREYFSAPGSNGRVSTPCCAPMTSWRSACWMRSMQTPAPDLSWSASTPFPRRSPPSRRGGCWPPPISTPWR